MNKNVIWKPDVMVIGPGGVKGFAELGVLFELDQNDLLSNVKTYIGVSIGSLLSLLIISGYTIREIITLAADIDILRDHTSFSVMETIENVGLISIDPIRNILKDLIVKKIGRVPSLQQLYIGTGIEFISTVYNSDLSRREFMSYLTEPDISAVDAVMLSMNIPFIFHRLYYNGCSYIDGAFGNPYPIDYLDDGKNNILGIYISNKNSTKIKSPLPLHNNDNSKITYILTTLQAPMEEHRKTIIKYASKRCKHICIEVSVVDSIGITVSAQDKAKMVIDGMKTGRKFINENILADNI